MRKWIAVTIIGTMVLGVTAVAGATPTDDDISSDDRRRGHHNQAEHQELREQIQSFLEDGVITAEELSQLPEGNPLTDPDGPLAEYLTDGQIIQDEFDEIRSQRQTHCGRGRGGATPPSDGAPSA